MKFEKKIVEISIDDIEEIILAQGSRLGNKHFELVVKSKGKHKVKIITPHLEKHTQMKQHILGKLFMDIENRSKHICFDSGLSHEKFWIATTT